MTLDPRRQALWQAMGLGPVWALRSAPAVAVEPDETAVQDEPVASGAAPVPAGDERAQHIATLAWDELQGAVAGCTACGLCRSRRQTVFGVGAQQAQWMVIGEAPGAEEDARGEPFVGQAGKLLDNMLAALGLSRAAEQADPARAVYIANVLKCRPPNNRNPEPDEVARCEPFLQRQVALLQPKLIIVMGRFAAQSLLGTDATIASLRGRVHRYRVDGREVPVIVTYHPAYLLRNLADKAKSWADLCLARQVFDAAG